MKPGRILLPFVLLSMLTSCSEQYIANPEEELKNELLVNFIKAYGLIDPQQNWNMATVVRANVNPAAFGDGTTVEVYNADPLYGGQLIGRASNSATLTLNVKKGASTVYAVARQGSFKSVAAGYYQIDNGTVNISGQPKATVASRADDKLVSVAENTNRFQWTIACEDLGSTQASDLDFNDIVLGINAIACEDHTDLEIAALAAGGTLPAEVLVGGESIGEIHDLIKTGTPTTRMVNTSSWSGIGKRVLLQVDPDWDMATDMGGISIVVTRSGSNLTSVEVHAPEPGGAPQMFCIAGDWMWPTEFQNITAAYPDFDKWIGDATQTQWVNNHSNGKVIGWKKTAATPHSLGMIRSHGAAWSSKYYSETAELKGKTPKEWDYVPGLVTKSMAVFCEQNMDNAEVNKAEIHSILDNVKAYVDGAFDGSTLKWDVTDDKDKVDNTKGFATGQLDNIASAKILINMYRLSDDSADKAKYQTAAQRIYSYLSTDYPRIPTGHEGAGGFFHKSGEYPYQMWLDGLFMGATFMAEYLAQFDSNNAPGWADIVNQFEIIHTKTFNTTDKLNYHAWTAAKKADDALVYAQSFWAYDGANNYINTSNPGCSQAYWGRGEGWYFAALVDVLSVMPEGTTGRDKLLGYFQAVAEGLKNCQDDTGVWYQLLKPSTGFVSKTWAYDESGITGWKNGKTGSYSVTGGVSNYLEASASCMFTYAFLKGIRLGYLDANTYLPVAKSAYQGLLNEFITIDPNNKKYTISHICSSAGLGGGTTKTSNIKYYRDGSESYYLNGNDIAQTEDEGKGIGPFILASIEWEMAGYE